MKFELALVTLVGIIVCIPGLSPEPTEVVEVHTTSSLGELESCFPISANGSCHVEEVVVADNSPEDCGCYDSTLKEG